MIIKTNEETSDKVNFGESFEFEEEAEVDADEEGGFVEVIADEVDVEEVVVIAINLVIDEYPLTWAKWFKFVIKSLDESGPMIPPNILLDIVFWIFETGPSIKRSDGVI